MTVTVKARYDGQVLHPVEPLALEPDVEVELTIEAVVDRRQQKEGVLLRTLRSLKLEGPKDWSSRYEEYLYGDVTNGE